MLSASTEISADLHTQWVKKIQLWWMNKQAKFIMDSLLVFINASTKHEKNIHGHVQYLVCQIFITNSIISLPGTVSNHDVSTSWSTHVIFLFMALHPCLKYLPFWLLLIYPSRFPFSSLSDCSVSNYYPSITYPFLLDFSICTHSLWLDISYKYY